MIETKDNLLQWEEDSSEVLMLFEQFMFNVKFMLKIYIFFTLLLKTCKIGCTIAIIKERGYPLSRTILIVEDEPSIVTLIKYNLEKEGFTTEVAMNGEDAIKIAESNPEIDLIVLDLNVTKNGWN